MQNLIEFFLKTWAVTQQMAPYLLFGFLMAGILSVLVSAKTIEAHLGRPGLWQTIKAALLGVPIPLCSCSVVPVSASLYRHGASRGATLSFLASTPQTGIDSIAVTWSLLGPVFVVFRVIAAFVSGILSGWSVQLTKTPAQATEEKSSCACHGDGSKRSKLLTGLHYGFVTLPVDIGRAMLVGLLISGVLTAFVPENFFADKLNGGIVSMLLMMLVGIPLYICSSASVPIAFGLIKAGLSPGAALVLLVTGPATNAATITTIARLLGKSAVVIYLACIALTALAAGTLLNYALPAFELTETLKMNQHESPNGFSAALAVLLLIVLAQAFIGTVKSSMASAD